jgi:FKBP-type peptidyl-prolyl cis-trans isomerase FkpA
MARVRAALASRAPQSALGRRWPRAIVLALPLGLAFGVGACKAKGAAAADVVAEARYAPTLRIDLKSYKKTASGLYMRDLVNGTGDPADSGQTVAMKYTGWLRNGTQFVQLQDPPLEFEVASAGALPAWDEALRGMKTGGVRQIIAPPALAYGANAHGPVPPNAILIYLIEVVAIR